MHRFVALTFVFALLLPAQVDHTAEGRKALEANDFIKAAEHFEKAVAAEPKDWAARFHLGLAYSLQNKDAEAVAAYRQVLVEKPDLYEAELNLGILLLRQNRNDQAKPESFDEARKLLASAATKKPDQYRPVYYLAESELAAGVLPDAEKNFRRALELQATSAEAAVGLARSLAKQGKLADADPLYRQAARDPEFKRALMELAVAYDTAGQREKAAELYREFPDDSSARERVGQLLLDSGKSDEAIPELEKAYAATPTNASRVALATAYLRAKQPAKALPLLEKAVAEEPQDVALRLYYGRAMRDQKNYQAAAREFFQAARLKPDSKEAWSELSGMLILLENYPQALAALDRSEALGAGDKASYAYFRGMIHDRMKDYKAALPRYEEFLTLSQGRHPEEEFKARQRIRVIKKELANR